jgi:RNA polymerase sigma-70 factor (ECF subfamily)
MYQELKIHFSVKKKKSLETHTEYLTRSIERYRLEVSLYLTRRVGCAETAADIFQSVAENLIRRKSDSPIDDVRAFLYRSAANAAVNLQRSVRTRAELEVLIAPVLNTTDDRSPETIAESKEDLTKVNQALQSLPILTRQIFTQYRLHGIRQRDIAEQLGVSLSTVEKHVKKALCQCYSSLHD